jgi:hypothetical protein
LHTQLQRLQAWAATERKGVETLVLSDMAQDSPRPASSCNDSSSWFVKTRWLR